MLHYLFVLGREPEISVAEIQAVFSLRKIAYKARQIGQSYIVGTEVELDCEELMHRLGGTIKIGREITGEGEIDKRIMDHLLQTNGKITFSLSGEVEKRALALKKKLQAHGRSVRYVPPKNTATILHNNLVGKKSDITIVGAQAYATLAIQPIEELSFRDYGRPGRSARSGMLPPKLAKIMINLASVPETAKILDPFCGSGTILTEALLMGYTDILGSDIDEGAMAATRQNLDWLKTKYTLKNFSVSLWTTDATKLAEHVRPASVDAIITEPFLGQPLVGTEKESFLLRQKEELHALYLRSFQTFRKLLSPGGTVVCALPAFAFGPDKWINIDCRKDIEAIGFVATPLEETRPYLFYARPDQRVGREIWRFKA